MEREDMQDMLARIDERVKSIQEDIRGINNARKCESNNEKIKNLERIVYGCAAAVIGIGSRVIYDTFK